MDIINSFLILLAALLLSYITNFVFRKFIPKLVKKTKSDTDDLIIAAIKTPITITILTAAVYLILNPYTKQLNLLQYLNNTLLTVLTLIWSYTLTKVLAATIDEIDHRMGKQTSHHDLFPFFKSIINILTFGLGLIIILLVWQVDVRPLLAAGGVAGIAVAFAAKDTVANIFGGISIFFDRPFKIGDYIIIDGQQRGEVIAINARTTKIKTRDDILISIPNSIMSTSKIVNETGLHPPLRIRVDVGLPYDCDLDLAEKVLFRAISKVEHILKDPQPRVRFRKFEDSYVKAQVMGWVSKPVAKGRVTSEVIKQIHKDLGKAHISIPFPQRDVHLHQRSK